MPMVAVILSEGSQKLRTPVDNSVHSVCTKVLHRNGPARSEGKEWREKGPGNTKARPAMAGRAARPDAYCRRLLYEVILSASGWS